MTIIGLLVKRVHDLTALPSTQLGFMIASVQGESKEG
jgi:hypothetical protein